MPRPRAVLQRNSKQGRSLGKELLELFVAALPTSLERATRDDVAAEMVLAILEGRASVPEVIARKGVFIGSVLSEYADKWGAISMSDEEDRWADRIEDETSLEAFEQIDFR